MESTWKGKEIFFLNSRDLGYQFYKYRVSTKIGYSVNMK